MCRKIVFLITFVLVLSFGTNALAEDLHIPYWAGAPGTIYGVWNFPETAPSGDYGSGDAAVSGEGDFAQDYPEEGLMISHNSNPDPDEFSSTYDTGGAHKYMIQTWANNAQHEDTYQGRNGVVRATAMAFDMKDFHGEGEKLVRIQITWFGDPEAEWWAIKAYGDDPFYDEWYGPWYEEWHVGDDNDLGGGWILSTFDIPIDNNPDWEHFEFGVESGEMAIDQVIIDTICYPGASPPTGLGRILRRGASNPRPRDGETRVDPNELLLIWDKDPCAVPSQEDVYFSHIWADVNDRALAALKSTNQDPNYWPLIGDLNDDVNLGETYYWAIDETVTESPPNAPGDVWSFTVKDSNAGLPDPENGADGVSPCPTLTWDPGYKAAEHYVYFSDIEAQVSGRTKDPCATLTEPIAETYSPGPLAYDTEYFWAVDENDVCDVLHSGPLWSFTTGPDPCTAPVQRNSGNSLYAMWGFDSDWGSGKTVADPCWTVPADPNFDANSVDDPCDWLASYTPAGGSSRSGIADNNGPAGVAGENSIRFKHTDYAIPGQTVTVLAELIWSGESSPTVVLERLTNWGDGPEPPTGWDDPAGSDVKDTCEPDPVYSFELCDGWMYSLYQAEFELAQTADNIHVVVETDGDFYLDYVEVDAWWRTPLVAHDPTPPDGDVNVPLGFGKLTWRPGLYADKHDVYFGTDEDAVADACSSVLVSNNQDPNSYPPAAGSVSVNPGTTYYWRVDEVNDACDPCLWPGQVWSFTTIPYILIEDFETYASSSELYAVWEDWHSLPEQGGETILEGSAALVHGDLQSMKFRYDQSYGEPVIRRTYSTPQDFSAGGLAALWMWIYGDANNAGTLATGMYIELGDDDNSDGTVDDMAKIYYGDPRTYSSSPYGDVNDLWRKTWYEWGVALEDFNDDNNVNPDKIKTIAFGVNGGNSGQIYFDDMRLYVPRCITAYALQFGNLVDPDPADGLPCLVDRFDLGAMSTDWMMSDIYVQSVAPGDANLLVEYLFEPNAAYDDLGNPWDSSGNAYHGSGINDPNIHDGILTLYGSNSVEVGGDFNTTTGNPFRGVAKGGGDFSISMDIATKQPSIFFSSCPYAPDANDEDASYTSAYHAMGLFIIQFEEDDPVINYDNWYIAASAAPGNPMDGEWHHVVTTYDADTNDHVTYLDAAPGEAVSFDPNLIDPCDHKILIGTTQMVVYPYEDGSVDMVGDIDNVRVYDKVLSHGEIVYLMGTPAGNYFHGPVPSDAELHTSEPQGQQYVNFRDEAVLANNWLKSFLWPPE
ncbi:MAG: LamG-like jellyroll fold domain-containing protein [Planctomycetota bacterium]|jgi:hypothetical protein